MNVARRSDGLLSYQQTVALIGLLERYPNGQQEVQLIQNLSATHPAVWSKGPNTLLLLKEMSVVLDDQGSFLINPSFIGRADWRVAIASLVAAELVRRLSSESAPHCLQNRSAEGLWLDTMQLPGPQDGFALWIVEFGVAVRDRVGDRFWRISSNYENLFVQGAREANRRSVRRKMSAAMLDEKLDRDAFNGLMAEEWVVEYERRRLTNHLLADQIRRISDENVAAGFDIASFSSISALQHDLYIEVKSFSGAKRFFWTRTEISASQEYGENYSLYLVDRSKMNSVTYEPQIIPGPYSALFQSDVSGWTISPTTYECVAPPSQHISADREMI